ncbi:GIN domain-containing protein [Spirosoma fluminis]
MKAFLFLLPCLPVISAHAQRDQYASTRELRGSGRIVRELSIVNPLDAIEINQFPAQVTVDVGAVEPSVTITLDDNLQPLLRVENENGTLTLTFRDAQNRPFWVGKASVSAKITIPALKRLKHGSNSNVTINNLSEKAFALANQANGNVTLTGKITTFDVTSSANGTIDADRLIVQSANVMTQANATIRINAEQVKVTKQAFANVINVADRAEFAATTQSAQTELSQKLVRLRFENNSPQPRHFTLISYAPDENENETNGFRLAPYANRQKQFSVGTAVYVATKS